MMRTNDPVRDAEAWAVAMETKHEMNRPYCIDCGDRIYGKYFDIEGECYCKKCGVNWLEENYGEDYD